MSRPAASTIEGSSWLWKNGRFRVPVLVRSFPAEVPFGFLGRIAPTSAAIEMRLELAPIAEERARTLLRQWSAAGEAELAVSGSPAEGGEREAEVERSRELARALGEHEQELWQVGLSFWALGGAARSAGREADRLTARLHQLGFATRVARFEAGPVGQPDGLGASAARPADWSHVLTTDGLAALFPFVDEAIVEPSGILVGLLLDDAAPIVLDRWQHSSHSWGMFGTTGAGKTFGAGLFLARSRWREPGMRAILLDPLGELEGLAAALGGAVVRVEDRETIVNPLDPATVGGDGPAKAGRVAAMLRAVYPSLADEEAATLDSALARLYSRRSDAPPDWGQLLTEVQRSGSPGRLGALLEPFCRGSWARPGPQARVPWEAPVLDFSLRHVPEAHRPFHLTYLLDALQARVRATGGPTLVVIDEAHQLARYPAVAEFFERWVREIRHDRAGILLLSQSPDDFLGLPSGRVLLGNLRATLLFRLDPVSPAAREFYGLTDPEADWLRRARLPGEAGYSEALLRHGRAHLPIAVVASTPEYEFLTRALGARSDAG